MDHLTEAEVERLIALWAVWWNQLMSSARPGPCRDWPERRSFDLAAADTGLEVEAVAEYISALYQRRIWEPREAMYGGAHRRS
jgi:hypothetical protein